MTNGSIEEMSKEDFMGNCAQFIMKTSNGEPRGQQLQGNLDDATVRNLCP